MVLQVNHTAPGFELYNQDGTLHRLKDYRGERVLVYFYPKDDTPGCTTEACSFRDDFSAYREAGVTILGISPDSQESHANFSRKYQLPFTLLADPDHRVCDAYGVWGTKKCLEKNLRVFSGPPT